jgi:hypothetical protein
MEGSPMFCTVVVPVMEWRIGVVSYSKIALELH